MFCHWNYVLEASSAPVRAVTAKLGHPHPRALGRGGRALRRDRRRRRVRDLRARRRGHRADQLVVVRAGLPRRTGGVPGRRHRRQRRRRPAQVPRPAPRDHAEAGVEPGPADTERFRAQWQEVPDNEDVRQRLQGPVGGVPPARRARTRRTRRTCCRRARRPARRARAAVVGRGPPHRDARSSCSPRRPCDDALGTRSCSRAPTAASSRGRSRAAPRGRARPDPIRIRIAYAAAHVVADPLGDNGPGAPAVVDWDATLAFRHHLWSYGLGVADAMDTAQRGMGLDWAGHPGADPPQRRRGAGVRRARSACGAGTDHAPATLPDLDAVIAAYREQIELVVDARRRRRSDGQPPARRGRHRPGGLRRGLRARCSTRSPAR